VPETPASAQTTIGSAWDLTGRVAVVTGASRGIGRAIALCMAQAGADVVAAGRSQEHLESLAAEVKGLGRHCETVSVDVVAEEAPELIVKAALGLGGLHVLINNAGGNSFSIPVETMRFSGWRKTMDLNLDSVFRLIQASLPHMGQGSSIVNVSSITALRGAPLMAHYAAAKAALVNLSQTLALEVAQRGIRVNALLPGWIATDLTEFLRENPAAEEIVMGRVPMARWGEPAEIAQAALFLASDASSFMTGQALVVDGGLAANP